MNTVEETKDNLRELKKIKWLMLVGILISILTFTSAWYIGLIGLLVLILSAISYFMLLKKLNSKMLRHKESFKMMIVGAALIVLGPIIIYKIQSHPIRIYYTFIPVLLGLALIIPSLVTFLKLRKEMRLKMKSSDYKDLMIVAVFIMIIVFLALHRLSILGTGLLIWSVYKCYKQRGIEKQKIFDSLK